VRAALAAGRPSDDPELASFASKVDMAADEAGKADRVLLDVMAVEVALPD